MMETAAVIFVYLFSFYFLIGFIFAVFFVTRGVGKIDPVAREVSWVFRLFIFPGSMALWPILLTKWIKK